jgi:7-cyano-7-deazaguanine reductase
MDATQRETDLVALGHPGNEHYAGLESFPNPGVSLVELRSDELVAVCPITAQPDMYTVAIEYSARALCLESKSLKLYLNSFRNQGVFAEALAVTIRDDVAAALGLPHEEVRVTLVQKARGGITITASV